ncbi:WD40-repeat-containing domain protein [Phlebopus sp. FC_14]|nr:WD40-repeat-containing domain protein [Phlebopus sp. FC_14]
MDVGQVNQPSLGSTFNWELLTTQRTMQPADGRTDSQPSWSLPLKLTKTLALDFLGSCHSIAQFPWDHRSLEILWAGALNRPDLRDGWKSTIDEWAGTLIIGGSDTVAILPSGDAIGGFCVRVPGDLQGRFCAVAWALSNDAPLEPLVVCSRGSLLYVINGKTRQIAAQLRGHGGEITLVAVHPSFPYLICTCSRDFSARIYDLTMPSREQPNNPHWPPSKLPSLGGAPHGLQATEPEGTGMGRCVAVLCGGLSGGHNAAVLNAAFHPTYPLIATCGLDRAVKIWRVPKMSFDKMAREDKPLFSSTRIHKARVMSVSWLSLDVLATHSAPSLMRRDNRKDDLYLEDGTFTVWRWLGFDRFFPPDQHSPAKVMRGCSSDYQESSSFKLLSVVRIPQSTRHLHVTQTYKNEHIIVMTLPDRVRILNIADFKPRKAPVFPLDQDLVTDLTDRLHLDDEGDEVLTPPVQESVSPPVKEFDTVVPGAQGGLQATVMGFHGVLMVTLDIKGCVWMWTETTD